MNAALQVYQRIAQGSPLQAARALRGTTLLDMAVGGPLMPLVSALSLHSHKVGEQFLDALSNNPNPQERLAEILAGRSPAQLRRMTYSLLGRDYGFRMDWPQVSTSTCQNIQDVLTENAGSPPDSFQQEVMRRIAGHLTTRYQYETLLEIGLLPVGEALSRDIQGTTGFLLENIEGAITLFFEWMREADPEDLMANCSPPFLARLADRTDRVYDRLLSDWPKFEGRVAADEGFAVFAGKFFRLRGRDSKAHTTLNQLSKTHPHDRAYFKALRKTLEEGV